MKTLNNTLISLPWGKMIEKELKEEILNKKDYVKSIEPTNLSLYSEFWKAIEEEALGHSLRIEFPKAKVSTKKTQHQRREEYKKAYETAFNNMRNAWLWAKNESAKPMDEKLIIGIAERIDPDVVLGYRHDQVRIEGSYNLPPRPEKVPVEMVRLVQQTTPSDLEKALYFHFEIARIHPFPDANGRTARMIQNLILATENLPPVIIYEGERIYYKELIRDAIHGYSSREGDNIKFSDEEKNLYNFLATKININLDKIIEYLEKHH